jgi:VWFA-related protein
VHRTGSESVRGADPTEPRRASRIFVLLFDLDHLSADALSRLKAAGEAFIKDELGPTDVAGIVANGRMSGGRLTNVKHELVQAVRTLMPTPEPRSARLKSLREFPRIESESEAARIASGDARVLSDAIERVCGATPVLCRDEGGPAVVTEQMDRKARQYVDEARAATGAVLRSINAVIAGLARMPGRKTLVLMTEGFFVEESLPAVQQIAAQAARNGVAIYGLDGRGLAGSGTREMAEVTSQGPGLSRAFDTAGAGPDMLAGTTGGMVIRNASHFAGALSDIARDTSSYYVLGYAPAKPDLDGSFRKIEVRMKTRRDVEVRARKGYLATPLPPPATLRGGIREN